MPEPQGVDGKFTGALSAVSGVSGSLSAGSSVSGILATSLDGKGGVSPTVTRMAIHRSKA